jgi:hypothetical protein
MGNRVLRRLSLGNKVVFYNGVQGFVDHFGAFDGVQWKKTKKKKANGVFLMNESNVELGYVHVWAFNQCTYRERR